MPIFKVTVKEKITHRSVAYVNAKSEHEADAWAGNVDGHVFRELEDDDFPLCEVEAVEAVDDVPEGWKVRTP